MRYIFAALMLSILVSMPTFAKAGEFPNEATKNLSICYAYYLGAEAKYLARKGKLLVYATETQIKTARKQVRDLKKYYISKGADPKFAWNWAMNVSKYGFDYKLAMESPGSYDFMRHVKSESNMIFHKLGVFWRETSPNAEGLDSMPK